MMDRVLRFYREWREEILFYGHIGMLAALPLWAVLAYAIDQHRERAQLLDHSTTQSIGEQTRPIGAQEISPLQIATWELRQGLHSR